MPRRILALTGTAAGTAARTAQTMRLSRPGSASSIAPPPLLFTVFAGQPKLRSTPCGDSVAACAAFKPISSGSLPSSWMTIGVPAAVRQPFWTSGHSRS